MVPRAPSPARSCAAATYRTTRLWRVTGRSIRTARWLRPAGATASRLSHRLRQDRAQRLRTALPGYGALRVAVSERPDGCGRRGQRPADYRGQWQTAILAARRTGLSGATHAGPGEGAPKRTVV